MKQMSIFDIMSFSWFLMHQCSVVLTHNGYLKELLLLDLTHSNWFGWYILIYVG